MTGRQLHSAVCGPGCRWRALYVKPNEISLERPPHRIAHRRNARRLGHTGHALPREIEMHTSSDEVDPIPRKHAALLDNVRLWDWRPFHDTVTQMQALRPYYAFQGHRCRVVTRSTRQLPARSCSRRARTGYFAASGHAIELDQSALHLYARLWAGAGGSQQDHAGWAAGLSGAGYAAEVKTPSLKKFTRPELYYWRTAAGAGFRRYGAGRVRLSKGSG